MVVRAVRSALSQTLTDLEVIVVDDGRALPAEGAVRSVGDARVSYLTNGSKHGGSAARNAGIHASSGRYVAFLDDDDQWLPRKLEVQVAALAAAPSDVAFSFTAVTNCFDDREERTHVPAETASYLERALTRFAGFLTVTLLIKREALEAVGGFDEQLPSHQEPDLIIRLSQRYRGLGIDEPLTRVDMSTRHEHVGSNLERRVAGREMVLAKHAALFADRPNLLARHLFWLGLRYREAGRTAEARSRFRRAWTTHRHPRYLLHYLGLSAFPWLYRLLTSR